jgi:putative N6-adenine-specific DNA methylase
MLEEELRELGFESMRSEASGSVSLEAEWPLAPARIMIQSRIASRVLLSLRSFSAKTSAMLYDQVRRIDWTEYLDTQTTFAVYVHGTTEGTDYTMSFAPLKIKDAIVDEIKKKGIDRPDVDRVDPDVRIEAIIHAGKCELSIDLTGVPLHRRSYRTDGREAPLRESRAAALIKFTDLPDGSGELKRFVDPFCGSGTLVIEAALLALKRAPGLLRPLTSFAMWHIFNESRAALEAERVAAERASLKELPFEGPLVGRDISNKTLKAAQENARRAGVEAFVRFEQGDARELKAPGAVIVANPPFGERLEHDERAAGELIAAFTRQLKHNCAPCRLGLILPKGELEHSVGFKPKRRMAVHNGPFEARFSVFEIFASRPRA